MEELTPSKMGKLSVKKRFSGKTSEEISQMMREIGAKTKNRRGRYSSKPQL